LAELSANVHKARELALKQINAAGGLLKGDQLRFVTADSGCDAKTAVDAAGKLINVERVVSVIGPTCSGETIAVAQNVTIPAGVMLITDSATSAGLTTLNDGDTVYRTAPANVDQAGALATIVKSHNITSIAMIVVNDDYNSAIARNFENAFVKLGGKVSASVKVEANKASYRTDLASLSKGGSKAIAVFAYYGNGGINMIKNSIEANLFTTFYSTGGMADQAVVDQIGADRMRDHLFFATPAVDQEEVSFVAYADAAKKAGFDPASPYVANGYDAVFLTALAIEKAGSTDRKLLPAALRQVAGPGGEIVRPGEWAKAKALIAAGQKINYEGASGSVDFDTAGDIPGSFGITSVDDKGKLSQKLLRP